MNRQPIARHEAGHFLVAMRLGHALDHVSIVADGERVGVAVSSAGSVIGANSAYADLESAVVFLAGPSAEGRFVDAVAPTCADSDASSAKLLLSRTGQSQLPELMALAKAWADTLVERWKDDIDRLTDALLNRECLSGPEVIDLFAGNVVDEQFKGEVRAAHDARPSTRQGSTTAS